MSLIERNWAERATLLIKPRGDKTLLLIKLRFREHIAADRVGRIIVITVTTTSLKAKIRYVFAASPKLQCKNKDTLP